MVSMKFVAVIAVLVLPIIAEPDVCTCEISGNLYTPLLETGCQNFTQTDLSTTTTTTLSCPGNLVFDLELCICIWPEDATCACRDDLPASTAYPTAGPTLPPSQPPTQPPATTTAAPVVCEQDLDASFDEFLGLAQSQRCDEAAQLEADIYAVCVVNDPTALAILSWRYLAVNIGFCQTRGLSDGCELLTECVDLLSRPGFSAANFASNVVCENLDAASTCLECAYNNGCPVASTYNNELIAGTPTMCPLRRTFSCVIP